MTIDYKKIFKSREMRKKILRLFAFVPDKEMLKLQYRIKFGRKLNLKNPKRFSEKLQWYKLYYRKPLMKICVDKADVRQYVTECGYGEILVPIVGVYNQVAEVDFDSLPSKCVFKDTLGGGGNSVIICKDKSNLNIDIIKRNMNQWITCSSSYKQAGREWPYGGKHRIIIENYLESANSDEDIVEYKFFCFYGNPTFLYVITDRVIGQSACLGIFNTNFEQLGVYRKDERPLTKKIEKPQRYEKMMDIARKLSEPFPEVRVDLYYVNEKIYFSEMTFYDGSGYVPFCPDTFDYEFGKMFILPRKE